MTRQPAVAARREREQTRARYPDATGYVNRDGVRVHWELYGEGTTTLLFLPTWSIVHSRCWKAQIPYFARHCRVLTFDPRGNGLSDRPLDPAAHEEPEYAADALAVMDATDTEQAVIVGLSIGGQRGLLLAAHHSERVARACFVAPALPIVDMLPQRVESFATFDDRLDGHDGWRKYNRHYWEQDYRGFAEFFMGEVFSEPHSTKQIEDAVGWALETTPEALIASALARGVRPIVHDLMAAVRCPVLVIQGTEDRIVPPATGRVSLEPTAGLEPATPSLRGRRAASGRSLLIAFSLLSRAFRGSRQPIVCDCFWVFVCPARCPSGALEGSPAANRRSLRQHGLGGERWVPRDRFVCWLTSLEPDSERRGTALDCWPSPATALTGATVRIHPIQTGTVAVKTRQREGVGPGPLRLVNTLRDPDWTEPLPILAWVIEHPEGLIVVDTGETALTATKGYFPAWHPFYRLGLREWVRPEHEIGPQIEHRGFSARDVRWVVLTHLHTDHAGGLGHFPHSEIVVSRDELRHASGMAGKVRGYLPHRWPRWFAPTTVEFPDRTENESLAARPLTAAGDVVLLATPGHTPGHVSVAIDLDGDLVILAGDASYTERLMFDGAVDGVTNQPRIAVDTLNRLRSLVQSRRAVYLPSHDPDSARRLEEMQPASSRLRRANRHAVR